MACAQPWSPVGDWLVSDGELPEVVSNHLASNLNAVEHFAVVNSNNISKHFWDNDDVSEVCLHWSRFLSDGKVFLRFAELGHELVWLLVNGASEASASAGGHELDELFVGEVEEVVDVNPAVAQLMELA